MPRSKKNIAIKRVVEPTSDDAPLTVPVIDVDAGDVDVSVMPCMVDGEADTQSAKDEPKKVGPKAARRAKTCEKCVQRRDREREYARIARSKSRSMKDAKKDATVAPSSTHVEITDPSAVQTVPEVVQE